MPASYYVFDFTASVAENTKENIEKILKKKCKKWTFQKEKGGETGYEHYQGRFSLKEKKCSEAACAKHMETKWHLSITSTTNSDNDYYVSKEETRTEGPWSDKDIEVYMPRQFRGIMENLRPFQKHIWENRDEFQARQINVVVDKKGNCGKTSIASVMECIGEAIDMPPVNDGEKLIQSLCDICIAKNERNPKVIFIDLPRSMDQDKLHGMYMAIEQIKKGKLYDFRYAYKTWWIDAPQVWIFCNEMPKLSYVSRDRWKIWKLNEEWELEGA